MKTLLFFTVLFASNTFAQYDVVEALKNIKMDAGDPLQRREDIQKCAEKDICTVVNPSDFKAVELMKARLEKRKAAMKELKKYPSTSPVSKTLIKNMEEADQKQFYADSQALCDEFNNKTVCLDDEDKKGWDRYYSSKTCKAEREFQILNSAPKEKQESMLAAIELDHDRSFESSDSCPGLLAKDKVEIGEVPAPAPASEVVAEAVKPSASIGTCSWIPGMPRKLLHGPGTVGCASAKEVNICYGQVACVSESGDKEERFISCAQDLCGDGDANACAKSKGYPLEAAKD